MKVKKKTLYILVIVGILLTTGTILGLSGFFGGGSAIPSDTMTRGLVGYWNFDGGSGSLVSDKSGQGNDGLINDGGSGNPVSYWTFDEGTGSTAYDYTGSNNGSLGGGTEAYKPTWTSSGRVGGALQFDGSNDYVGADVKLISDYPFTITAWAKRVGSGIVLVWLGDKDANDKFWELEMSTYFTAVARNTTQYGCIGSVAVNDSNWHFAAAVFVSDTERKIYTDGLLNNTCTDNVDYSANVDRWNIGRRGRLLDEQYFAGLIDDVRIYNYARDAAQIKRDYLETYKTKYVSGAPSASGGTQGNAMQFDGRDDFVSVSDSSSMDLNGLHSMTMEFWVNSRLLDGTLKVLFNRRGLVGGDRLVVAINASNKLYVINDIGTNWDDIPIISSITANTWYHFVYVYNGSQEIVYLNGTQDNQQVNSGGMDWPATTYQNWIGAHVTNAYYFNGTIDEVRIYNRALSAAEVRYHYNRGGPVAYWTFDEGSGTTAYDSTNNNNNGTISGATWVSGKNGNALNFDGSDDYITVTDTTNSSLDITSAITMSVWINPNVTSSAGRIIWKQGAYALNQEYTGAWRVCINPEANCLTVTNQLTTKTWHHIAGVYNGSFLIIYADGKEIGRKSQTGSITANDNALLIGAYPGPDYVFDGLIDDVRIYNYARSADEIKLDYNAGFSAHFGPSSGCDDDPGSCMTKGLVGNWSFDQGSGPLAFDASGNGNDGVINDGGSGNPVAYWTFDEGTGQTAYDYTSSNNGTLGSGASADAYDPVWTPNGRVGGALQFDGVNDYVNAGSNSSLAPTSAITVAAWVYPKTFINTSYPRIADRRMGTPGGYNLMGASDNKFAWEIYDGSSHKVNSSTGYSTNRWYHVVGTYDGGNVKIYINGVLDCTPLSWVGTIPANDVILAIGSASNGVEFFNGLIDDVRIYNYARGAAQIKRDYLETYKTKFAAGAPSASGGSQGNAMQFDGVDDWVDAGNNSSLRPASALSLESWVKTSSAISWQFIAGYEYDSLYASYNTSVNSGNATFVVRTGVGAGDRVIVTGSAVNDGNWHHIVGVFTGSQMILYLDGKQNAVSAWSGTIPWDTSKFFKIGNGLGYSPFNGSIDEVHIYNRALSATEVRYHYNQGGPVAYWTFDEGSGTTAYDSTNSNNNGTVSGATWVSGKNGNALQFDGTDDYVNVGNGSSLQITKAVSVSAWIKSNGDWGDDRIFNKGAFSGNTGYILSGYATDNFKFTINGNSGRSALATGLSANTLYHITGTYDGQYVKIYVNGVLIDSDNFTVPTTIVDSGAAAGIGDNLSGTTVWPGVIDDVRVYNYARTTAQVREDYNVGLSAHFGPSSGCDDDPGSCMTKGLVGNWNFDGGSGSLAFDASGNGNDGVINDGGSGNPVSYWTFDEGTGQTAYDYVGSNNGTLTNGPVWTSSGRVGGAIQFDGSSDYVNVPDSASLRITGSLSVEFWAKRQGTGGSIIAKESTGGSGDYWINNPGTGNITANSNGGWGSADSGVPMAENVWYHISFTLAVNDLKVYVNGEWKATDNTTNGEDGVGTATSIFLGRNIAGNSFFPGLIDDVRIYNYARGAAQIKRDYQESYKSKFTAGAPAASGGSQGNALQFDGVDDWVDAGTSTVFDLASTISTEGWVYCNQTAIQDAFWGKWNDSGTNKGWYIGIDTTSHTLRTLIQFSGGFSDNNTFIPVTANAWHHVAFTFDGTNLVHYLDGVAVKTTNKSGQTILYDADLRMRIGLRYGVNIWMNGKIDDVRVYNRALSPTEIRYHYNKGGPVGYWKFDEGQGGTAYDNTNNNNDGTISGATWVKGKYGSALSFDGTDDIVYTAATTTANFVKTNAFTIEAWVYNATAPADWQSNTIICNRESAVNNYKGWEMAYDQNQKYFGNIGYYDGTWHSLSVNTNNTYTLNQWHHVAFVNTGIAGEQKIYINGINDSGTRASNTDSFSYSGTPSIYIGRRGAINDSYMDGKVDDVRIYNYARTPAQILQDYNQGTSIHFK